MNMSYCRFQNTVTDLRDCYDNLGNRLSEEESEAREDLVELCRKIVSEADNGGIPDMDPEEEIEEEDED